MFELKCIIDQFSVWKRQKFSGRNRGLLDSTSKLHKDPCQEKEKAYEEKEEGEEAAYNGR